MKRRPKKTRAPALEPALYFEPMKAEGIGSVPQADEHAWHCEIKFDGYRAIAAINEERAELWSRNHKPLEYPELLGPLAALQCRNAVIDGEIIALDPHGRSNFQTLQGRDLGERPEIVYYIFDLLFLNGRSLLGEPIERRQEKLAAIFGRSTRPLLLSPVYDVQPKVLFQKAKDLGLEGIVLKRRGSLYEPGRRSGAWLKIKHVAEQEFVIGGFTAPRRSREHFGAILVGYFDRGRLRYAGKVGTGFDRKLLLLLKGRFDKLKATKSPFDALPTHKSRFGEGLRPAVIRTTTWLKPTLVAQIKFAEWTQEGLLRQPVFLGLRGDKQATNVRREAAMVA